MLYLSRRVGEAVIINNAIEVRVVEVRGKSVKLGFSPSPDASILCQKVFEQIRNENQAAVEAAASLPAGLAAVAAAEPRSQG